MSKKKRPDSYVEQKTETAAQRETLSTQHEAEQVCALVDDPVTWHERRLAQIRHDLCGYCD